MLISRDLAQQAVRLQVDIRRFLFLFRYLRADADLRNGLRIGRGFPRTSE